MFSLELAYFTRHPEALCEEMDDRRIDIVDARAQLQQLLLPFN